MKRTGLPISPVNVLSSLLPSPLSPSFSLTPFPKQPDVLWSCFLPSQSYHHIQNQAGSPLTCSKLTNLPFLLLSIPQTSPLINHDIICHNKTQEKQLNVNRHENWFLKLQLAHYGVLCSHKKREKALCELTEEMSIIQC